MTAARLALSEAWYSFRTWAGLGLGVELGLELGFELGLGLGLGLVVRLAHQPVEVFVVDL